MAKQTTLKVNRSFDEKVSLLEQTAEDRIKDELRSIGQYAVSISPVDTGAYVESFSMLPGGQGGGRSRSSDNRVASVKNGGASRESFTQIAISNIFSDIEQYRLENSDKVTLRNRAPHARKVEDGWVGVRDGYSVFTKVRDKFG